MQIQERPLEEFFYHEVRTIFEGKLRVNDPEVTGYVAQMLCDFAEADSLFLVRGAGGHTLAELNAMRLAADPVRGTAPSFDAERAMRKYIGDYALFAGGMVPEATDTGIGTPRPRRPTLSELISAGKESYYIVSQFNIFEYKKDAPLFGRLSDQFERYILGLSLVREELGKRLALSSPAR